MFWKEPQSPDKAEPPAIILLDIQWRLPPRPPITDFPLSPKHFSAGLPVLHFLFPFFFGLFLCFVFLQEKWQKANRWASRLETKHISSVFTQGEMRAVRIQQSPCYLQLMALKDARAGWSPLWATCVAPLMRLKDDQNSELWEKRKKLLEERGRGRSV